jgi:hypothetical protein
MTLLGGIRSQEMVLEDFLPIVQRYRSEWFPVGMRVKTCTSPMGEKSSTMAARYTPMEILRRAIGPVIYRDNGNAHDVRLGLIESLSGYLRRRTSSGEESIAVNDDASQWLVASREGIKESAFLHIALEAGYTWDKHFVSVSSKEVKKPQEDDKFANVVHCVENIILNFCAGRESEEAADERRQRSAEQMAGAGGYGASASPNAWMF